ncbi:hypothetical protein FRC04_003718 [Tulasnella sp. 424]|nr:hypothetical protein FRC04_003718 [Tulasnella sp. 424]
MAKSLRAKCNKPHKAAKRNDPKSAYAAAEAARLQALNARLVAKFSEPIVRTIKKEVPVEKGKDEMDVEGDEPEVRIERTTEVIEGEYDKLDSHGKISTSGRRLTSRNRWIDSHPNLKFPKKRKPKGKF